MSSARLYELGYLRYEGRRTAPSRAVLSLLVHSFRSLLGIRRRARAKALPIIVGGMAYLPAIVFVGIAFFLPEELTEAVVPGSAEYFSTVVTPVWLFIVLGAPSLICPDRRHGTLALYFASPLDRDTYLIAKAGALALFLALVIIGPGLLLLLGLTIAGVGTDGPLAFLATLGRLLGMGVVITMMFTSITIALASLTDRRAAAAAFIGLWLVLGSSFVGILTGPLSAGDWIAGLDVTTVAANVAGHIGGDFFDQEMLAPLPTMLVALAWVVVPALFARWRYHRLAVTR